MPAASSSSCFRSQPLGVMLPIGSLTIAVGSSGARLPMYWSFSVVFGGEPTTRTSARAVDAAKAKAESVRVILYSMSLPPLALNQFLQEDERQQEQPDRDARPGGVDVTLEDDPRLNYAEDEAGDQCAQPPPRPAAGQRPPAPDRRHRVQRPPARRQRIALGCVDREGDARQGGAE